MYLNSRAPLDHSITSSRYWNKRRLLERYIQPGIVGQHRFFLDVVWRLAFSRLHFYQWRVIFIRVAPLGFKGYCLGHTLTLSFL